MTPAQFVSVLRLTSLSTQQGAEKAAAHEKLTLAPEEQQAAEPELRGQQQGEQQQQGNHMPLGKEPSKPQPVSETAQQQQTA